MRAIVASRSIVGSLFVIALWAGAAAPVQAARIAPGDIPPPLRDWTGWVLHGQQEKTCPFLFNAGETHRCAWPSTLSFALNESGGSFSSQWELFAESWVELPGDPKHWPQEVSVDGRPAALVVRDGRPQLRLAPGRHELRGSFRWNRLPESLPLPVATGLVSLEVNGQRVAAPQFDPSGNLWLQRRADAVPAAETGNRLNLQVARRIIDDVPLQVTTRIELEVSGLQREELLGKALLPGLIPLRLNSALPARVESDGNLRVQVRPGRWNVEFTARAPAEMRSLALAETGKPWPAEEIWVFEARNELRLVEVEGVTAVDPQQVDLPDPWRQLPAYLMQPGAEMKFKVIRRGDPEPEPDQLTLYRNLWLDFDGGGYTIQDQISGSMRRGWRLEAAEPMQLGQALLDGTPQFITTLGESGTRGIEVRRGSLNVSADSRLPGDPSEFAAVGWEHDFQQVNAVLHLPPGWDLLGASGIDNVPDTWVKRWTLLDIFLVLIAAIAVLRLWSPAAGALALVTLVLLWHEPDAPRIVWLHLLAAIALLRVLPAGKLQWLVRAYRNVSLLVLLLVTVPFLVDQVRSGLYPQLRMPWIQQTGIAGVAMPAPAAPPAADMAASGAVQMEEMEAAPRAMLRKAEEGVREGKRTLSKAMQLDQVVVTGSKRLQDIDPDARIQTGPGLPNWQWRQIALDWNGPVQKDQQVSLWLLSPVGNLVANLLRVLLVAALAMLVTGFRWNRGNGLQRPAGGLLAVLLALPLFVAPVQDARAEFPDGKLLDELRARLLAPAECLPECAQSPRLRFDLTPDSLTMRIEMHAQEAVAVPLPARSGSWLPAEVSVDGAAARGLFRTGDGMLWVQLDAGAHQVVLRGALPNVNTLQLPLPLPPRHVEFEAQGWSVGGVADNQPVGSQLQFTRQARAEEERGGETLAPSKLPPFVRVDRTLTLGLDWSVDTVVRRLSPADSAVVMAVPLIAGESVTSDGIKVEDGRVLVNMAPGQREFAWTSALEKADKLTLTAADTTDWVEFWRADIAAIWHLDTAGIAVVHHQSDEGRWLPQWRPWPGESVELTVRRPAGVEGQVLTVDLADLRATPGLRATDSVLTLNLRSGRGGQHTVQLPEGAELQTVLINGTVQPVRQEGRAVTLPLAPGAQSAELVMRSAAGLGAMFRTPQVDLGVPGVNNNLHVTLGDDRWVLLTGGPRLGPAVLFWGVLLVIVLLAYGLGRVDLTPLRMRHWLLLGIGLSQVPIWSSAIVVGWLLALGARARFKVENAGWLRFNFLQFLLALLTLVALVLLFDAIKHGLLGLPEMQIAGNNSSAYDLHWYQDRSGQAMPQAWVLSVSLWFYRGLMLAWALWLAFALLRWLRWGWECFSSGGYWKPKAKVEAAAG
jgi:hypothetical protein